MIRALYAWYLQLLVEQDEAELTERTADGSASPAWAIQTRMQINNRIAHIKQLRAPRISRLAA